MSNYWILGGGLLVTLVLLFIFFRFQPKPEVYAPVEEAPAGWFKKYWALIVAGIIYAAVVGATLAAQLSGATATTALTYTPLELTAPAESRYQAINRAGDVVGEMDCMVTPEGETFSLACNSDIEAYEAKVDNSTWIDEGHTATLDITWQTSTYDLLDYAYVMTSQNGGVMSAVLEEGSLVYTTPYDETSTTLPEQYLIDFEWPWKISNLDNSSGYFFKSPYVYLNRWDNDLKKSVTLIQDEVIHIAGEETLYLPAGEFKTIKVTLGSQTAWYALDDADGPRPVQFDDGMLTYSLMK